MQSLVIAVLAALLVSPAADAQRVSPGLEMANPEMKDPETRKAIRQRVEEFLGKLGDRDLPGVRALLAPKGAIIIARQQKEGGFITSVQTFDDFVALLEKNADAPKFKEPLTNVEITVDSGFLGYLRADFTVVREGKVVSSGVDQFTLVKEPDGWKIAVVAYTSIPR
jgi:hypothetical protein